MRLSVSCGAVAWLVLVGCGTPGREGPETAKAEGAHAAGAATVPIILDHGRVIVEVDLVRPGGGMRRAAAWVDTGNQYLVFGEALAEELGLDRSGVEAGAEGHPVESASPAPPMRIGGVALNSEGVGVRVRRGRTALPGIPAEVCLPAGAFKTLHVVFDGTGRAMTVAPPGVLTPRGEPVPCRVNPETGLLTIDAMVGGDPVALGVDTGSAGTWVSRAVAEGWPDRYPDLAWAVGAAGSANFFGFPFEVQGALTSLPELGIGGIRAADVAVLALGQGMFDWYSQKSAGPVVGFIGGNVISRCRLEVDWPNRMTWWELGPAPAGRDLDIVGLTLRPATDGSFAVVGIVERDGVPTVSGVEVDDLLVQVDELEVQGSTMGEVVDALRGAPGETRTIVLVREGKRVTVEARVARLP